METTSTLGKNRTGIQTSPRDVSEMLTNVNEAPVAPGEESALVAFRQSLMEEADMLGSVPPPATAKGMLKSGLKMVTGKRPQALIDKMAERLAFERTGVRLYESLLTKLALKASDLPGVSAERLTEIRDEEMRHFALLVQSLQEMGADPTAETPAADLVGVESLGLLQAISDARTTFAQSLHAILIVELADNEGWDMLIDLAQLEGNSELADRFRRALEAEERHLDQVRTWIRELARSDASVFPARVDEEQGS
jgi:rubrerythrin